MNPTQWLGLAVFVAVPLILWVVGSLISRTKHGWEAVFAYVTGAKNRLSLSRAQAFAWTLVIFGSFTAAMVVHNKIQAGTAEEMKQAEQDEKALDAQIAALTDELHKKQATLAAAQSAERAAVGKDNKDAAAKAVTEAKAAVAGVEAPIQELQDKKLTINPYKWVLIPPTLLALAGIAIASGVFSSVITVVSGETKEAELSSIDVSTVVAPPAAGAGLPAGQIAAVDKLAPYVGKQVLTITGTNFGEKGKVRLVNSNRSEVEFDGAIDWQDTRIQILFPQPAKGAWTTLIVDTPDGKLCHQLDGNALGPAKAYYELADLFREDKDPTRYDLMKFQMFGWTVIAICIYIWLFLSDLRPDLASLPVVPESIVLLTGLSQAGYLGGKAVSNMGKPPAPA